MTAGCTLTDVFACHCSVRLCWNGAFFARERLTIRQTFRVFCTEQGKTALLAQWDIERNLPLTPDDVTFGSHKRVWWTCPSGHSWQAMVYTRSEGAGCPYCTGRKALPEQNCLAKQFPMLAVEWDSEKNAPLTPKDITPGSHKLIWWRCQNGHSYRSAVKTRVQGSGCPYCAGKNVLPEETSLATEYPSIAKEWDAAKNVPLLPTQVISGTRRKVWWRCPKGHSWRAAVYSRTTLGTGCPVCTGRQALAGENDLATLYPDIAAQWDEEKNGVLHPNNVTAGSNRRVWWKCEKGHSYRAMIAQRVQRGDGCPYCANRKVLPGFNDLATAAPLVAKQWHESLNGALTPEMVTAGSPKKAWWQCSYGHAWKANIYSRAGVQQCGCPVCARKTKRKTK
ncbi:zinc-ribbon domain-containing protein [Hominenteromicrobium sp.]|uniref:zinc-ribbon domain-containing protein n=1 Tax=Hominenteromicrobium sp. TaxID=3073581 RepID=UPI003AF55DF2